MIRSAWLCCLLAAQAQASPYTAAGVWTGLYNCAQGQTALELDVTVTDPLHLQALFYFHAAPANPLVPDGCFLMQGGFSDATSTLSLSPTQWLLQPNGYVWVGLSGILVDGSLAGSISGPGCSSFSLTRSAGQPDRPAPCKPPQSMGIT